MSESPYVRINLAATKAGAPNPALEVECWLDQLEDLLDARPETAEQAYDVLALTGKLRRVRPELIAEREGTGQLSRADTLLAQLGPQLATVALEIPNPDGWFEEAQTLEVSYEELIEPAARSELAERLLSDLDDAQLVVHAARKFGIDDPQLEALLASCEQWLAEHADLFLAASVYVQAVGIALRPDLEDYDYGLAVTALKYVDVLRAAEVAEAQLALANVSPLPRRVVRRLADIYQGERERLDAERRAFLAIALALWQSIRHRAMAHAGEETLLGPAVWWEWASPVGDIIARLTLPPQPASEDEAVSLEFVGPDKQRATSLAGQPVTLHGVRGAIDDRGKATFPIGRLLETAEPLVLRLGAEGSEWNLLPRVPSHDKGPQR
jgi:hypothetical protein